MSTFIYNDLYFYSQINPDFRVSFNHIYVFVIFFIVGFLTFQKKNSFNNFRYLLNIFIYNSRTITSLNTLQKL